MFYHQTPEAQLNPQITLTMHEFAYKLDPRNRSDELCIFQDQTVNEIDKWGDMQTYSFVSKLRPEDQVTRNPVSGLAVKSPYPVSTLWLQQKTQRNMSASDFERLYGDRLCDPSSLVFYGRIAILNAWTYGMGIGDNTPGRTFQTEVWGYKPGQPNAEKMQIKQAASAPLRKRLLSRSPKPEILDYLLEAQQVRDIFAKLGYTATRLSHLIAEWTDRRPEFADFRAEFPN